jgi:hypothetical protein
MDIIRILLGFAMGRIPKIARRNPAYYGLPYEDVQFPSAHPDQVPLSGWLLSPAKPQGVVLLSHGIGSTREFMLKQAVMIHQLGWASLLFDFRARGGSGGNQCTFGQRETDDVRGAVNYLKARPELASLPLVGSGQSLGAASLVMAMAEDQRIQGAILEACFARLTDAIGVRCRWLMGPWAAWAQERVCQILLEGGVDAARLAPVEFIASIAPRPLLLIHDSLYVTMPRRVGRELYERAGDPKQFWMAPYTPHAMVSLFASSALFRRLRDFLGQFA